MSLQSDTVELLTSLEVQRINFRSGSVRVYGSGFGTVASAVENGRIMIAGMESRVEGGLLCEYQHSVGPNGVNRLLVDVALNFNAAFEAQLVIHEATHALMDYHARSLDLLDSEAAGYIAGLFYCVVKNVSFDDVIRSFNSLSPRDRDEEMVGVYTLAYGIAQSIFSTRGGYSVAARNVDDLKQTIARTRLYRRRTTETVVYDGL
jgi:hypothetical protein